MTAGGEASDAELVGRVRAGDRDAFAQVYERYADRLFDFAVGMLRNREDAADAVADSFVTMAERLEQLRDPSRLRPWLYAVVRRECLRRLSARKRVAFGDDEQLEALPDSAASPDEQVATAALRELVWDAAAGLGERDRALLDLHLRHGLEGQELAEAMGITAGNAYTSLNRLKTQVERSLGALLIARLGRDDCAQLGIILEGWDGTFSVLLRKRVARHVDGCLVCDERRAALSPLSLLASVPLLVAPSSLRDRVLGEVRLVATVTDAPSGVRRSGLSRALLAGAAVLALLGVVSLALLDRGGDTEPAAQDLDAVDVSVTPSELPSIVPAPEPLTRATSSAPSVAPPPTSADAPTSAPPSSSTPPEPTEPQPGLVASPPQLDLGERARAGGVTLTNVVTDPVDYTWSTPVAWLVLPPAGVLAPGESVTASIYVDRSLLPPGPSEAVVTVAWPGGSLPVTVRATGPAEPTDGGTIAAPGVVSQNL